MNISDDEYSGSFGHYFQYYLPGNRFGDVEQIMIKKGIIGKIISHQDIYHFSPINAVLCNLADNIINFCKITWECKSNINICFIDSDQLSNAFCAKIKDRYVICYFSGLIGLQLRNCSIWPCTEAGKKFTGISNDLHDTITEQNYKNLPRYDGIPDIITSKDPSIFKLLCGTFGTVIFHEIGHILNGHLDFILSKNDFLYMDGIPLFADEISSLRTQNTLEFDADAFAAIGWLNMVQSTMNNRYSKAPEFLKFSANNPEALAEFSLVCSFLMFLGDDAIPHRDSEYYTFNNTHSSSDIRSWCTQLTIAEFLRHHQLSDNPYKKIVEFYFGMLSAAVLITGNSVTDMPKIMDYYLSYLNQIWPRWATLRDTLQLIKPSKRGNLAPASCDKG